MAIIVGREDGVRSIRRGPSTRRRRCPCGCGRRATHIGFGDGVALMSGCEMYVRRWVRNPDDTNAADLRRAAQKPGGTP